jgi:hypothetical protein
MPLLIRWIITQKTSTKELIAIPCEKKYEKIPRKIHLFVTLLSQFFSEAGKLHQENYLWKN